MLRDWWNLCLGIDGISCTRSSGIGVILCPGISGILQPHSGERSWIGGISNTGLVVKSGLGVFPWPYLPLQTQEGNLTI